jgi:hypothetical protein
MSSINTLNALFAHLFNQNWVKADDTVSSINCDAYCMLEDVPETHTLPDEWKGGKRCVIFRNQYGVIHMEIQSMTFRRAMWRWTERDENHRYIKTHEYVYSDKEPRNQPTTYGDWEKTNNQYKTWSFIGDPVIMTWHSNHCDSGTKQLLENLWHKAMQKTNIFKAQQALEFLGVKEITPVK